MTDAKHNARVAPRPLTGKELLVLRAALLSRPGHSTPGGADDAL
ncbi:MAG: hypothetical protein AVDCRST_MAG77-3352 [uncultured Chloroflexi bacterium]|uniref:Uncharacterized protein n=1 Tax=uncultured Chloroflexota bacterium TaxID=166587 RepID=A0A6J4JAH2_9CHLR|nr:MAG: hypothetical protein AVDCRST_MAG77-3352 [uncultured Chloroflexota bacterium]